LSRNPNRLKVHAKKRLQRVYKNGEQLLKVAEACLDGYAKFEMEAYILSMQANYLMETK